VKYFFFSLFVSSFPYFSVTPLFFRAPQVVQAAGWFQTSTVINKIFEMYIYKEKVKGLESGKKWNKILVVTRGVASTIPFTFLPASASCIVLFV